MTLICGIVRIGSLTKQQSAVMPQRTNYSEKRLTVCVIQRCAMKSPIISALQQGPCYNERNSKPTLVLIVSRMAESLLVPDR